MRLRSRLSSTLTSAHRREFEEHGCLLLPAFIDGARVRRLRGLVGRWLEFSREMGADGGAGCPPAHWCRERRALAANVVLGAGHSAERPRVTRIANPVEVHEAFWELCAGPLNRGAVTRSLPW